MGNKKKNKTYLTAKITIGMLGISLIACSPAAVYHPPVNEPPVLAITEEGQLSIMTYNIQTVFGKDETKLAALLDYIALAQFDFVLFQELFDEDIRDHILQHIDRKAYQSVVSRIDYDTFPENLFQDAGLFLMSKYPQVDLSGIGFEDQVTVTDGAIHMVLRKEVSLSTDFLANKSVMGSLHELNDSTYLFIFTTHLQALGSKSHKRSQYRQIKNFIEYGIHGVLETGLIDSSENLIVLLTGDFNSDGYDEGDLEILTSLLGYPRDLHSEFNPSNNEYTMRFSALNMYKRFDYIFAYDQIGSVPLKKVKIHSINATDLKSDNNSSISDHLALKASLMFSDAVTSDMEYYSTEKQAR